MKKHIVVAILAGAVTGGLGAAETVLPAYSALWVPLMALVAGAAGLFKSKD